ncbi:MAG: glycosyltransferase [Prevotellaceae bacterium]|nr:glycosyltransferase [Candidatus Minthosoma caballi]
MRILHVITSLRTGGAEKLMVELLPRLKKTLSPLPLYGEGCHPDGYLTSHLSSLTLEMDVKLLVFDGVRTPFYEELERRGVKIHSFGENCSVYNPLFVFRLIPFLRQFDIVHTHNTACQMFVAMANVFVGTRIVTTEHNTSNRRRGKWYWKMIDKWMYRQYSDIICISDQTEVNLREHLANDEGICGKIKTVYNGVDVRSFVEALPLDVDKASKYIIAMVAAFRPQKDQDTLVKAIARLPKQKYELWLVGGGSEREEIVKQLAKDLGIADRVKFLGIRNDIPSIVKTADVVVLSSHYEGLSLSSIEGMASGKPFIASDVDGLHEIVNGYGILVPHEDDKALAEAIKKCCEDKEYAAEVGKKCQVRAMMYDISVMAEGYNDVYKELMS